MSAVQAVGTIISGQAARQAGEYNAELSDFNAVQAENDGKLELMQQQREGLKVIGQARAHYGASGVDSTQGSALDVLQQSATQSAIDSLNIQKKTSARAYGYRKTADLQRYEGEQAETASYFSAAGQLLASGASMAKGGA